MTTAQEKEIFSSLKEITEVSKKFLTELESLIKLEGLWESPIGASFKNLCPNLTTYSIYVNNYDNAIENLSLL